MGTRPFWLFITFRAMSQPALCRSCQAPLIGPFCAQCGARAVDRCASCGAELSSGARFCHRCGSEATATGVPKRDRTAWVFAALAVVAVVAMVAYQIGRGRVPEPAVADMGNAGNAAARATATPRRAPDISQMTPRERFDRLWDRVMRAAEARAADTVLLFAPMALGAYQQLDSVDIDARFHAAMIHVAVGELAAAKALADTIAATQQTHLFAPLIRADVAEQENDTKALSRAYAQFLAAYDAEIKANRPEYLDHRPILDDFHTRASANARK